MHWLISSLEWTLEVGLHNRRASLSSSVEALDAEIRHPVQSTNVPFEYF